MPSGRHCKNTSLKPTMDVQDDRANIHSAKSSTPCSTNSEQGAPGGFCPTISRLGRLCTTTSAGGAMKVCWNALTFRCWKTRGASRDNTPLLRQPLWTARASRQAKKGANRLHRLRCQQEGQRKTTPSTRRHARLDDGRFRAGGQHPRPRWG